MQILISGGGEVVLRFVDHKGHTLMQERLVVAGPAGVHSLRQVPLTIQTTRGPVGVAPVVVSGGGAQRVTFDGEDPAAFIRRRCREIGCSDAVTEAAARGVAAAPASHGTTVNAGAEPTMSDVLETAPKHARPPGAQPARD